MSLNAPVVGPHIAYETRDIVTGTLPFTFVIVNVAVAVEPETLRWQGPIFGFDVFGNGQFGAAAAPLVKTTASRVLRTRTAPTVDGSQPLLTTDKAVLLTIRSSLPTSIRRGAGPRRHRTQSGWAQA